MNNATTSTSSSSGASHIAFLFGTFGDRGPAQTIPQVANALAEQGYRVDILVREYTRDPSEFVSEQVRVFHLGRNSAAIKRLRISNFTIFPQLIKYLKNEKPDSLFSAGDPLNFLAYAARTFTKPHKTSLVVSLRNSLEGLNDSRHRLRNTLMKLSIRISYLRADAIVAVSNGLAEEISALIPEATDRITTIHTHIDIDSVRHKASETIEAEYFEHQDLPLVITAGRLTQQKDHETLIRAFTFVLEKTDARLVILGDGEEKDRLVLLAQELGVDQKISFLGNVANPYKFMQRAHTFVLSSRWEGFSRVLVEAAACNCSLVSTDCPVGPSEVLAGGQWGRLVPIRSPKQLGDAILASIHYPIKASARADDFTLSNAVRSHERLFETLATTNTP